ncbi:MAG: methyltransferase [Candidatus Hydrogenedentota bacterium]
MLLRRLDVYGGDGADIIAWPETQGIKEYFQLMSDLHEFTGKISEIANAFKQSQILFWAVESDVFSLLEKPQEADNVAHIQHWDPHGARLFLDGLVGIGLVEKQNNRYVNTPAASACLVPGKAAYQGAIIRHTENSWEPWARIGEAVRTGEGVVQGRQRAPRELRDFILGMGNIAMLSAPDLLEHIDISPYRHMLDIGGGPSTYTITFLRANPNLRTTLMDFPDVVDIAREQVDEAGLAARVDFLTGDCTKDPLGAGYDLILASNVVHILGPEQNAELVKKCFDALEPTGTLVIKDFITDPGHTGPPFSLIFALHMLLHTEQGRTYSQDEVQAWTDAAGFAPGELRTITPKTRLWIARKP